MAKTLEEMVENMETQTLEEMVAYMETLAKVVKRQKTLLAWYPGTILARTINVCFKTMC
tara:strand:+ start:144 stop:320 length:177 start_codon:yes stop_codon:yes gene_type:complete